MRWWVLLSLSACGFHPRLGASDPDAALADAALGDGGAVDASTPQSCFTNWLAPGLHFGARTKLTPPSTASIERDPSLSEDELSLWFASDRGGSGALGGGDVWVSTRTSVSAAFGAPVPYNLVNSAMEDGKFTLSDDGLTYLISTNRTPAMDFDLYASHRATTADTFPAASSTLVGATINNANAQHDPWINRDGTVLYYAAIPLVSSTGGGQRIFRATRATTADSFGPPTVVPELDVGNAIADPTLFDNDLVIVFSSNRSDNVGGGNSDLWFATRATTSAAFSAAQHVPDVNTADPEGDPWVSPDGCRLYFATQVSGNYDLYEADVE